MILLNNQILLMFYRDQQKAYAIIDKKMKKVTYVISQYDISDYWKEKINSAYAFH